MNINGSCDFKISNNALIGLGTSSPNKKLKTDNLTWGGSGTLNNFHLSSYAPDTIYTTASSVNLRN